MSDMNPAETLAALRLLEHALKEAISVAQAAAEEYRATIRAKSLETDLGLVSITRRSPSIVVDDTGLIEWCQVHAPHLITPAITPAAKRALVAGWAIDGDEVIDTATGELIGFAQVRPGGESLTVRLTPEAKARAIASVTRYAPELAEGFSRLLAEVAAHELPGGAG